MSRGRDILQLLLGEDIRRDQVDLGVSVLSGLGGGHVNDLAGSALDDDESTLSEGRALHGVGGGSTGGWRARVSASAQTREKRWGSMQRIPATANQLLTDTLKGLVFLLLPFGVLDSVRHLGWKVFLKCNYVGIPRQLESTPRPGNGNGNGNGNGKLTEKEKEGRVKGKGLTPRRTTHACQLFSRPDHRRRRAATTHRNAKPRRAKLQSHPVRLTRVFFGRTVSSSASGFSHGGAPTWARQL